MPSPQTAEIDPLEQIAIAFGGDKLPEIITIISCLAVYGRLQFLEAGKDRICRKL
jgi:hypothetical protein